MPEYIEKQARIFRAGNYPGKGANGADFSVSVADLERIAAGTQTPAVIHAHDEKNERLDYGIIDGKSLQVRGDELWGTLSLYPDAVPFLERNGIKSLSAGITLDKTMLKELSMTRKPHIKDAAWFSEENPGIVFFSLSDESEPSVDDALDLLATFAGKTISSASSAKIKAAHDALSMLDPDCCPSASRFSHSHDPSEPLADERKTTMGFFDRLLGKSDATDAEKAAAKAEFHEAIKEAVPAPAAPVDNTAQFAAMQKRIEQQDAELFAQRMLSVGKITPVQFPNVIAEFTEAAEDDRLAPRTVTFSVGTENKQGTRVERVKAKYETAQPNRLTEELMPDGHYAALFNRETSGQTAEQKKADQEAEYQKLRPMTSLGKTRS